ncbi:MAG: hypothetical protein GQ570_01460 [Helicobacteraceae bacterium]|nr:hypothetical protein [Helicobacteraceae bacterium]
MSILKYVLLYLLISTNLFAVVDLNNATSEELLELNGIGKAKSQKIVDYRDINGCFKSLDELGRVDGISKKIILSNKSNLTLGKCKVKKEKSVSSFESFKNVLLNPINLIFTILIFVLAYLDYRTGKDLKSQIVSLGVLGTFVGIFIGLQAFNPDDIIDSVNDILVGLKIAFFTSIVGMSVSTFLSLVQKFQHKDEDE